jgi:anti-anti-sigma factor
VNEFRAVVERGDGTTVVELSGDLDMAAVPVAEARFGEALEDSPAALVVDLTGLAFLDSSGIRMLLMANAAARTRGVELSMTRPPEGVWRLLERFHLHSRLPFTSAPTPTSDAATVAGRNHDVRLELAADPQAPGEARRATAGGIPELPESVRDVALLLVSEVVTNAVRHGCASPDDRVQLSVAHRGDRLRVEVEDPGPGVPELGPRDDPLRESGWGLVMVDRFAASWGTEANPSRVWFELNANG